MKRNQLTYNIFCDASVGPELRGSCSGALVCRKEEIPYAPKQIFYSLIQPNGTNNSGEVCAVSLGIHIAIDIHRYMTPLGYNPTFRIFSDSLITIKGIREWLIGWIKNSDNADNLKNSSGNIVANQEFFKSIYNKIISNPSMNISFYHQDGHVVKNFNSIIPNFIKFNGIDLRDIGLEPISLCSSNDFVDRETRRIINQYLSTNEEDRYDDWKYDRLNRIVERFKNTSIIDKSENALNLYSKIVSAQY